LELKKDTRTRKKTGSWKIALYRATEEPGGMAVVLLWKDGRRRARWRRADKKKGARGCSRGGGRKE